MKVLRKVAAGRRNAGLAAAVVAVAAALALAAGIDVFGGGAPAGAAMAVAPAGAGWTAPPPAPGEPLRPAGSNHWREINAGSNTIFGNEGETVTYDVHLQGTAPTGDVTVTVSSDNADVTVNWVRLPLRRPTIGRGSRLPPPSGMMPGGITKRLR